MFCLRCGKKLNQDAIDERGYLCPVCGCDMEIQRFCSVFPLDGINVPPRNTLVIEEPLPQDDNDEPEPIPVTVDQPAGNSDENRGQREEVPRNRRNIILGAFLVLCACLGIFVIINKVRSDNTIQAESSTALRTGDTILLGSFEQDDNPENGKESLGWIVREVADGKALLLCDICVNAMSWNSDREDASWTNSNIRSWLNGEFFDDTFSEAERKVIMNTELTTRRLIIRDEKYEESSDESEVTTDKVFIPDKYQLIKLTGLPKAPLSVLASFYHSNEGWYIERDSEKIGVTEGMLWLWTRNSLAPDEDGTGRIRAYGYLDNEKTDTAPTTKTYATNLVLPALYIDIKAYSTMMSAGNHLSIGATTTANSTEVAKTTVATESKPTDLEGQADVAAKALLPQPTDFTEDEIKKLYDDYGGDELMTNTWGSFSGIKNNNYVQILGHGLYLGVEFPVDIALGGSADYRSDHSGGYTDAELEKIQNWIESKIQKGDLSAEECELAKKWVVTRILRDPVYGHMWAQAFAELHSLSGKSMSEIHPWLAEFIQDWENGNRLGVYSAEYNNRDGVYVHPDYMRIGTALAVAFLKLNTIGVDQAEAVYYGMGLLAELPSKMTTIKADSTTSLAKIVFAAEDNGFEYLKERLGLSLYDGGAEIILSPIEGQ